MKRNKVGLWNISATDLKNLLYLPESINIDHIWMPEYYDDLFMIKLKGHHKALYDVICGEAIPILTKNKLEEIWKDKAEIRKLSDKVKFIRYKEEE